MERETVPLTQANNHHGAGPILEPVMRASTAGSEQFEDFVRFILNLNQGQKTTKRSIPGIVIKELLALHWFEKNQALSIDDVKKALPIAPKLINRLFAYFLRCGAHRVVGDQLLPTTHQIEKIRNTLIASDARFTSTDDHFGLRVKDPLFSTVNQYRSCYH